MYFVLNDKPIDSPEPIYKVSEYPEVAGIRSWISGRKITVPVPKPLAYTLDEFYTGRIPDYYNGSVPFMSDRLIKVLIQAGVDNVQYFEAVLRSHESKVLSTSHYAINVVGAVSAADMHASVLAPENDSDLVDVSFDSLTIDKYSAGGLLLFRLAESMPVIIVHQKIRDLALLSGITNLGFVSPEDWLT